jgi:hypothetical protein
MCFDNSIYIVSGLCSFGEEKYFISGELINCDTFNNKMTLKMMAVGSELLWNPGIPTFPKSSA